MNFKHTAIAAACLAIAPWAHAQYSGTGTTNTTPTPQATSQEPSTRMGNRTSHDSDTVRQVQQQLSQRGFDPGPVDGMMGPQTRAALRNFQQAQGITGASGLDQATLDALGIQAASSGTSRHDATSKGEGTMGTAPGQQGTPSSTASPSSAGQPSTAQPRTGTSRHDAGATGEGTMGTAPSQNPSRSGTAPTSPMGSSGTSPMSTTPGGTSVQDARSTGEGTMGTAPTQQPNSPRK
jgi:Putative peptidoglycan binding domain